MKRLLLCVMVVLLAGFWLWHEQAAGIREGTPIAEAIHRLGPATEADGGEVEHHYTWTRGTDTLTLTTRNARMTWLRWSTASF